MVAWGGHAWLLLGGHVWLLRGVHGCSQGACVVAPGWACVVAWGASMVARGAFVVAPGGYGGCAWLLWGGMCGCSGGHAWLLPGACMVFSRGGMHGFFWGGMHRIQRDTVNEWAVRILLECILVTNTFTWKTMLNSYTDPGYSQVFPVYLAVILLAFATYLFESC